MWLHEITQDKLCMWGNIDDRYQDKCRKRKCRIQTILNKEKKGLLHENPLWFVNVA